MTKRKVTEPWPEDGSDSDPRWEGPIGEAILNQMAGRDIMSKQIEGKTVQCADCQKAHYILLSDLPKQLLCNGCGSYSLIDSNGKVTLLPDNPSPMAKVK